MSNFGEALAPQGPDYSTWSTDSLIARITELERQLHAQTVQLSAPTPSAGSGSLSTETVAGVNTKATSEPSVAAPTSPKQKKPLPPPDDFTRVASPTKPAKVVREIDPSKYHTRFIALKFAYLGQRYNGYEHANGNTTPLPTIEEELWKALRKTRLIFPTGASGDDDIGDGPRAMRPYSISWDGCEYSKCGRTDRGVSAFGQVISLRVRSARPKKPAKSKSTPPEVESAGVAVGDSEVLENDASLPGLDISDVESEADSQWDDVSNELPYIHILNNVLPEDIRILAWCPHPPPGFDARFSCRERQYRYFFTQPAFSPTPGPAGFARNAGNPYREGWLDIDAMREAAKHFEGVHDFRNFCKLDTSKQIENFERIIYHADIELVDPKSNPLGYVGKPGFQPFKDGGNTANVAQSEDKWPSTPQVYTFTLHGSAFLWHQVRHMVAILFLVGQGLESPSIVPELLDIAKNPRKPAYDMASDAPLVLWDCIFPDESSGSRADALEWIYAGDPSISGSLTGKGDGKFGLGGIVDELWSVWRQRKIDEVLAGALLDLAVSQGDQSIIQDGPNAVKPSRSQKVFYGGNEARAGGKYVPVMKRRKLDAVEVQNARYLASRERRTERNQGAELDNA
ncbi:hypothetical protein DTO212C5_8324 [Paecilomyces variotii]|nr:hypothetical protein DTO212C5_8324 [Paecilomyces variotii]